MTSKILATSLVALLLGGCSNEGGSTSPTTTASSRLPTAGAPRVAGDIVPGQLLALSIPKPTETALLHGSDALAPRKAFELTSPAPQVVGRDMWRVMKGSGASAFTFPLDAPAGARVIVHPVDPNLTLPSVHLVDAATGAQLDRARDVTPNSINSRHMPLLPDAPTTAPADARLQPQFNDLLAPIARENGTELHAPSLRALSFDQPTNPGTIRVSVPANVAAQGIYVEVQQPNSHITLAAVASEANYTYGDVAEITCTVMNDASPVSGATLDATVVFPDNSRSTDVTFTSVGAGQYMARIPLTSSDAKMIGVWGLRLHGTGTANGAAFERSVDTAIGYYPAHAHITALGVPVVSRGGDGLVDEVSVDADIETLADDRFSVRGTLTYTGTDGQEHPLAAAQTGQTLTAGKGTMTLHFDAASMALARVDGPFHVRDVALVSQAYGHTQHRLGRALDLLTAPIAHKEIRFPHEVSLQAQDLIENGDLEAIK